MAQGQQGSLPAAPPRTPGLPNNPLFYEFAGWEGIDTKPPRPGIDDSKVAWCDNLMPLGPHNLRAMPDRGPTAYTSPGGLTITHYDFFGLASTIVNNGPHAIVFLSDGSAADYAIFPNTTTTIAPAGTFAPPAGTIPGTRQYGTNYLLIATQQAFSAYWAYDGANLYGSGSVGPEITLLDTGRNYTSAPTVAAHGGSGSGSSYTATVANGQVTQVQPTSPGSGWTPGDPQLVFLTFSGGGGPATAFGQVGVNNGALTGIEITFGGSGFTSVPSIIITDATGTGAVAIVTGLAGGTITSIEVIDCGGNYTNPTISTSGGGGSGLVASGIITSGVLIENSVSITVPGGPYLEAPDVHFLSATGSGASGTAILDNTGAIHGVDFGKGLSHGFTGSGYTSPVYIYFSGGGVASATQRLMPFGVNGRSIESFNGRAWVTTTFQGTKTYGTAPGSAVNFSPGDGGFVFPATESDLKFQWSALRQSNGFLYLVGDSSVNYISGVNTSGSPATTTFSNLNVDPQIGSPWPESVEVFSRAVMIANSFGIHAIYGGSVQKVSTPLDGVFGTGTINPNNLPHAAVAEIFGVHCFMLLMPITDPITGSPRNCLFLWDSKRWWTASQSTALSKVRTNEWGSVITAWGCDSGQTTLFPLFQNGTTSTIQKTLQAKLNTSPGIHIEKKAMQLYALWKSTTASTLGFTIDTDNASLPITQGTYVALANQQGWGRSAVPDNYGVASGFSMASTSSDFTLIDVLVLGMERRLKV